MAGLAATLLFFGSVLAHELSHSVVARSLGLRVVGITLFVFGGVSTLASEADDAWTEIKVAAAGPLMSFVLGAFFLAGGRLAAGLGIGPPLLHEVLHYLFLVNLVLGVFNLLPGFPLDGGRVLRAAWWIGSGSRLAATRIASRAGTAVAVLLIALGLWRVLAHGDMGGLWMVLIGLFLRGAAASAGREGEVREVLGSIRVEAAITPDPPAIPATMPLDRAATDYFLRFGQEAFPVEQGGAICGLLTLAAVQAVPPPARAGITAGEAGIAAEDLPAVPAGASLQEAVARMGASPCGWIRVMDQAGARRGFLGREQVERLLRARRRLGEEGS